MSEQQEIERLKKENEELRNKLLDLKNGVDIELSSLQMLTAGERKYRHIFEHSPDAIVLLAQDGTILDMNNRVFDWLGYKKEEIIGLKIFDAPYFSPDAIKTIADNFKKRMSGDIVEPYEISVLTKDGRRLHTRVQGSTFLDEDKNTIFNLAFISNITALKKAEKLRKGIQKKMFQNSRLASIGELASGVSHEINNPLLIIMGCMEVMEEELKSKDCEKKSVIAKMKMISSAADRIESIVKGLKAFSKSDADKIERINICDNINKTISLIRGMYEKDGIDIQMDCSRNDFHVTGNRGKLQQVFLNILSNSRDAFKNRGGDINIRIFEKNNLVNLTFTDNGCGIDKNTLDRIFDLFYSDKDPGQGSGGIGLGLCKSLVENMDGTIAVESNAGEGTDVILTFPILKYRPIDDKEEKTFEFRKFTGTVLIVDDEPDVRFLLKSHLEGFGLTVDEAEDGHDGLEKIRKKNYDHIITDLKMPRMDGGTMLAEISKQGLEHSRIYIITGAMPLNDDYIVNLKKQYVLDGFVEKPFTRKAIYKMLKGMK